MFILISIFVLFLLSEFLVRITPLTVLDRRDLSPIKKPLLVKYYEEYVIFRPFGLEIYFNSVNRFLNLFTIENDSVAFSITICNITFVFSKKK